MQEQCRLWQVWCVWFTSNSTKDKLQLTTNIQSSNFKNQPYKKHNLVHGCYNLVDKVNYNLACHKVVTTLSPHCDNLIIKTVIRLWQPCHKVDKKVITQGVK